MENNIMLQKTIDTLYGILDKDLETSKNVCLKALQRWGDMLEAVEKDKDITWSAVEGINISNKTISVEIIKILERFGFRKTSEEFYRLNEEYSLLYMPCNNNVVIWKIRHIVYKLRDDIKLFECKLNNPQELEFILKSLNII